MRVTKPGVRFMIRVVCSAWRPRVEQVKRLRTNSITEETHTSSFQSPPTPTPPSSVIPLRRKGPDLTAIATAGLTTTAVPPPPHSVFLSSQAGSAPLPSPSSTVTGVQSFHVSPTAANGGKPSVGIARPSGDNGSGVEADVVAPRRRGGLPPLATAGAALPRGVAQGPPQGTPTARGGTCRSDSATARVAALVAASLRQQQSHSPEDTADSADSFISESQLGLAAHGGAEPGVTASSTLDRHRVSQGRGDGDGGLALPSAFDGTPRLGRSSRGGGQADAGGGRVSGAVTIASGAAPASGPMSRLDSAAIIGGGRRQLHVLGGSGSATQRALDLHFDAVDVHGGELLHHTRQQQQQLQAQHQHLPHHQRQSVEQHQHVEQQASLADAHAHGQHGVVDPCGDGGGCGIDVRLLTDDMKSSVSGGSSAFLSGLADFQYGCVAFGRAQRFWGTGGLVCACVCVCVRGGFFDVDLVGLGGLVLHPLVAT